MTWVLNNCMVECGIVSLRSGVGKLFKLLMYTTKKMLSFQLFPFIREFRTCSVPIICMSCKCYYGLLCSTRVESTLVFHSFKHNTCFSIRKKKKQPHNTCLIYASVQIVYLISSVMRALRSGTINPVFR